MHSDPGVKDKAGITTMCKTGQVDDMAQERYESTQVIRQVRIVSSCIKLLVESFEIFALH
jgi:hypothetical protein